MAASRHFQRSAIAAALVMIALAACAQGATAATKGYSLTIAPDEVPSGVVVDMTAAVKNETAQSLGSANLTPPPGYAVQSVGSLSRPAPATAALVGGVVQLRNLSLAQQESATVTMTVSTPCSPGVTSEPWDAVVKQANDFNGSPGNNLTLDPAKSSLTTTTVGACVPCIENVVCTTSLDAPAESALGLRSDPSASKTDDGLLTISQPSSGVDCAGYEERADQTYRYDAPLNRGKVGVLTYDATTRPVTSRDPTEVCFASPSAFPVKPKTLQTTMTLDGQFLYVGRLPNCIGLALPPCVTSRDDKLRSITFRMAPGDPYSR